MKYIEYVDKNHNLFFSNHMSIFNTIYKSSIDPDLQCNIQMNKSLIDLDFPFGF